MTKTFTAYTQEIDDVEAAVREILRQLDLEGENKLLANTVGIVSCYAEFVDSGVWKALCEQLPFDVVGTTTITNSACGQIGETMLTLMVLTSDTLRFATSLSDPIAGEDTAVFESLYAKATAKLTDKPALMLSFVPLLTNIGSDYYVETMTEISGNVPNFGTLAVDHNEDYHDSYVLMNGGHWRDRFAIVLIQGPIRPVFFVGGISEERVFPDKGVVTASAGNQLQTVNGAPAAEYLQSLGLTRNEDGTITGINSFPVIVDYNDGTEPVVRVMFALTPEGYAVCGGNIPIGSTLSIGSFDPEEVKTTTRRTIRAAAEAGRFSTMLIYSCIGRYFTQGFDPTAEFQILNENLDGSDTAYMAAYSGGELCPVYDKDGRVHNRNHNNTFIVCAF